MRGGHRHAKCCCQKEREGASRFSAEALNGLQLRNTRTHRMDDPPPTEQGPERHRGLAAEYHPQRNMEFVPQEALREEQDRDDAHGLLRVVTAMAERVHRR